MTGYCADCGNTLCICDDTTAAAAPQGATMDYEAAWLIAEQRTRDAQAGADLLEAENRRLRALLEREPSGAGRWQVDAPTPDAEIVGVAVIDDGGVEIICRAGRDRAEQIVSEHNELQEARAALAAMTAERDAARKLGATTARAFTQQLEINVEQEARLVAMTALAERLKREIHEHHMNELREWDGPCAGCETDPSAPRPTQSALSEPPDGEEPEPPRPRCIEQGPASLHYVKRGEATCGCPMRMPAPKEPPAGEAQGDV